VLLCNPTYLLPNFAAAAWGRAHRPPPTHTRKLLLPFLSFVDSLPFSRVLDFSIKVTRGLGAQGMPGMLNAQSASGELACGTRSQLIGCSGRSVLQLASQHGELACACTLAGSESAWYLSFSNAAADKGATSRSAEPPPPGTATCDHCSTFFALPDQEAARLAGAVGTWGPPGYIGSSLCSKPGTTCWEPGHHLMHCWLQLRAGRLSQGCMWVAPGAYRDWLADSTRAYGAALQWVLFLLCAVVWQSGSWLPHALHVALQRKELWPVHGWRVLVCFRALQSRQATAQCSRR
jgi:hypothetical protein